MREKSEGKRKCRTRHIPDVYTNPSAYFFGHARLHDSAEYSHFGHWLLACQKIAHARDARTK